MCRLFSHLQAFSPCSDVALLDLRGGKILRSKAVAQALGMNAIFFSLTARIQKQSKAIG